MSEGKSDKGLYLELRVARLLFAEGLTPFVNVWFREDVISRSVSQPDIDVMGCRFLPDATIFFAHYDCKSGDSKVVNRILLLSGLGHQIPPGPIVYIRKHTALDIKRYAMQNGIRIVDISQIDEKEKKFVKPIFGDTFPSISDRTIHELWLSTKGKSKSHQLGRILDYFDYEFWAEGPLTRLKRSIAAAQLIQSACTEIGVTGNAGDLLTALVIRRFLFSLLNAASHISLLSVQEVSDVVKEQLITEKLPISEYHSLIESTAQLIFEVYGDPSKGPLKKNDYYVPPPEYAEELTDLLGRSVELHESLPAVMPAFDALIIEDALRARKPVSDSLLRGIPSSQIDTIKQWMRSVRLFLVERQKSLSDWTGWKSIINIP